MVAEQTEPCRFKFYGYEAAFMDFFLPVKVSVRAYRQMEQQRVTRVENTSVKRGESMLVYQSCDSRHGEDIPRGIPVPFPQEILKNHCGGSLNFI